MASITLTLDRLKEIKSVDEVVIKWHNGIKVSHLKRLLLEGVNTLTKEENQIWALVSSKEGSVYGFAGRLDTDYEERVCYNEDKSKKVTFHMRRLAMNVDQKRINDGRDYKLDFGKVVDQTIAERMEQHFRADDYLEHFRREAMVYFPLDIIPLDESKIDEYINTIETILIKGDVEKTHYRLGVCNKQKIDDPKLQYPIKRISNKYVHPAFETDIYVTIKI